MIDDSTGCWNWDGQRLGEYGVFRSGKKLRLAHRHALEVSTGKSLGTLWALHKCGNKACCNPAHLYAGSPSQNVRDHWQALGVDIDRRFHEALGLVVLGSSMEEASVAVGFNSQWMRIRLMRMRKKAESLGGK